MIFLPLEIPENKFLTVQEVRSDATTFGSSMVDIFADVPEAYTRNKIHPELRTILNNLANELKTNFNEELTILKNDLPFVELTTMQKEDNLLLIHLVNYNVTVDGDITPAKNINVQISLPEGKTVRRISYDGKLGKLSEIKCKIKEFDGKRLAYATFPDLNIYGLAKIELESR